MTTLPLWIEEVITSVTMDPPVAPPAHTRHCQTCGAKYETGDIYHIWPAFCPECRPKYEEYCNFLNNYTYHEEQKKALDKVVYRYKPDTGEEIQPGA